MFSTFHSHYLGGGEDESGGEKEKDEKECGIPQEKEKMRFKEG